MGSLVLKAASADIDYAKFGPVSALQFASHTFGGALDVPTLVGQVALPANVKILAASAVAIAASGNALAINVMSGPNAGTPPTLGTGTITFTTTATHAGTCTVVITGSGGNVIQTTTFAIGATNTVTQSAAAMVTALNTAPNPTVYASNSAGVVTLYQLANGDLGSLETYQASLSAAVTGQTVSPTTATAFTGSPTSVTAPGDNSLLGTQPPTPAAAGDFWLPRFGAVTLDTEGVNTVVYPPNTQLPGVLQVAAWDSIFPVTRTLGLVAIYPGYAASTTLQVTLLIAPVLLATNNWADLQWQPNNTTIGAPSTD